MKRDDTPQQDGNVIKHYDYRMGRSILAGFFPKPVAFIRNFLLAAALFGLFSDLLPRLFSLFNHYN